MQESIRQASDTFLAIGPSCEVCSQAMLRLLLAISPGEGRKPTTPQNAAGFLTEPPVSEPVASGTMPVASATADPPDEPAAERSGSKGIAGGAMQRVAGVAARAPFGDVGLADNDGARAPEHRNDGFILGRDVVLEQHAAKTRRQSPWRRSGP
jgi:hypothetical protein